MVWAAAAAAALKMHTLVLFTVLAVPHLVVEVIRVIPTIVVVVVVLQQLVATE